MRACSKSLAATAARQGGVALIELIAALVIMALALAGFASLFGTAIQQEAEPVLRHQALGVADAYMNEILAHPYPAGACPSGGAGRPGFGHPCQYDALANNGCTITTTACPTLGDCACRRDGSPIEGLRGFTVAVSVQPATVAGISGLGVSVSVSHDIWPGEAAGLWALRTLD